MDNMNTESLNDNNSNEWISNRELADQVINKFAGKNSKSNNKRSAPISKDDDEYQKKRARNNVAVKKSREKAKSRIQETQVRVEQLSKENEELQTKVNLLSKELNVLRSLFTNGGFTLPVDLQYSNGSSSPEHAPSISYTPPSHLPNEDTVLASPLHVVHEGDKYHHPSEDTKITSKIPPLRPTPRIPSTSPNHHKHQILSPPSMNKFSSDRYYSSANMLSKVDYAQKDIKIQNGPPLLIAPEGVGLHNSHHKGDIRHPSVIRSTTDVNGPIKINVPLHT